MRRSANLCRVTATNAQNGILRFETPEINSFTSQILDWTKYFQSPATSAGLPPRFIEDPTELRQLTAFFAWTAWASVAQRPGTLHSYTNNFPYEPMVGNSPTGNAVLWSALSLITLLGGVGIVLFAFGKFSYLGWKGGTTPTSIRRCCLAFPRRASGQRRSILSLSFFSSLLRSSLEE